MCLIPFILQKGLNLLLVKEVPLQQYGEAHKLQMNV